MIKVEKNIPIPPLNPRKNKYPWATMNVGESFVFGGVRGAQSVYDANCAYKPKKFTSRNLGNNMWRIWRIK